MLNKIINNNWIEARGIVGFYPANQLNDDDIELFTPEGAHLCKLHTLR